MFDCVDVCTDNAAVTEWMRTDIKCCCCCDLIYNLISLTCRLSLGDEMCYSYYMWLKLITDTDKNFIMSHLERFKSRHNMNYNTGNIKMLFCGTLSVYYQFLHV